MSIPMAAVFDLNEPAHVVHWHFFQMSDANIAVILAMLVVFALAILIPFPGAARRQAARQPSSHQPVPPPLRPTPGQTAPTRIENEP